MKVLTEMKKWHLLQALKMWNLPGIPPLASGTSWGRVQSCRARCEPPTLDPDCLRRCGVRDREQTEGLINEQSSHKAIKYYTYTAEHCWNSVYWVYVQDKTTNTLVFEWYLDYLNIKVSWEFLLNRLHPGTWSSLVCETPFLPWSTM